MRDTNHTIQIALPGRVLFLRESWLANGITVRTRRPNAHPTIESARWSVSSRAGSLILSRGSKGRIVALPRDVD
jgi:hypothetical protein